MSKKQSGDNSGNPAPVDTPTVTEDVLKRSDERMKNLLKFNALKGGADVDQIKSASTGKGGNQSSQGVASGNGDGVDNTVHTTSSTPSDEVTQKTDETSQGSDDQSGEDPKPGETRVKDWEKEAKSHQSRADKEFENRKKAETQLTEFQSENEKLKDQLSNLSAAIDEFKRNPQEFIVKNFPDVAKSFNISSDPLGFIEKEVKSYRKELDEAFKKTYGDDWKYSETKSLEPETPSFRYRLAVEDKIAQLRRQYEQEVDKKHKSVQSLQDNINKQRESFKSEYGFEDEELKEVDEYFKSNPLTYDLLARAVLLDKIIEKKIASIPKPDDPPPDLGQTGGGGSETDDSVPMSKQGKGILSRIGTGSLGR